MEGTGRLPDPFCCGFVFQIFATDGFWSKGFLLNLDLARAIEGHIETKCALLWNNLDTELSEFKPK